MVSVRQLETMRDSILPQLGIGKKTSNEPTTDIEINPMEKAKDSILNIVSNQVPATQKREEAQVKYGAVVAIFGSITDFIVSYPCMACRWRILASRLAVHEPDRHRYFRSHTSVLVKSHILPWVLGQRVNCLEAWGGAGLELISSLVETLIRVTCSNGLDPGSVSDEDMLAPTLIANLAVFQLRAWNFQTVLFGNSIKASQEIFPFDMEGSTLMLATTALHIVRSSLRYQFADFILHKIQPPPTQRVVLTAHQIYLPPMFAHAMGDIGVTLVMMPIEAAVLGMFTSALGVETSFSLDRFVPTGRLGVVLASELVLRLAVLKVTSLFASSLSDTIGRSNTETEHA